MDAGKIPGTKFFRLNPVHTTLEKYENGPITGQFGFVFEAKSVRKITLHSMKFTKSDFVRYFLKSFQENPLRRSQMGAFKRLTLHICD